MFRPSKYHGFRWSKLRKAGPDDCKEERLICDLGELCDALISGRKTLGDFGVSSLGELREKLSANTLLSGKDVWVGNLVYKYSKIKYLENLPEMDPVDVDNFLGEMEELDSSGRSSEAIKLGTGYFSYSGSDVGVRKLETFLRSAVVDKKKDWEKIERIAERKKLDLSNSEDAAEAFCELSLVDSLGASDLSANPSFEDNENYTENLETELSRIDETVDNIKTLGGKVESKGGAYKVRTKILPSFREVLSKEGSLADKLSSYVGKVRENLQIRKNVKSAVRDARREGVDIKYVGCEKKVAAGIIGLGMVVGGCLGLLNHSEENVSIEDVVNISEQISNSTDARSWSDVQPAYDISNSDGYEGAPDICGSAVVWQDRPEGQSDLDIYLGYVGESEGDLICDAPGDQRNPAVSPGYIVWEDERGEDSDIYCYSSWNETVFPVCTAQGDQSNPAIRGSLVVWEDDRKWGDTDIYMRDLETREAAIPQDEAVVCDDPGYQIDPDTDGERIVWASNQNGDYDIYRKHISSGEVKKISSSSQNDWRPSTDGDITVWEEYHSGNSRIVYYSYDASETNYLSDLEGNQVFPDVCEMNVVWQQDSEIYMVDLYEIAGYWGEVGAYDEDLVSSSWNDQAAPTTSGGDIVWMEKKGSSWDIFTRRTYDVRKDHSSDDLELRILHVTDLHIKAKQGGCDLTDLQSHISHFDKQPDVIIVTGDDAHWAGGADGERNCKEYQRQLAVLSRSGGYSIVDEYYDDNIKSSYLRIVSTGGNHDRYPELNLGKLFPGLPLGGVTTFVPGNIGNSSFNSAMGMSSEVHTLKIGDALIIGIETGGDSETSADGEGYNLIKDWGLGFNLPEGEGPTDSCIQTLESVLKESDAKYVIIAGHHDFSGTDGSFLRNADEIKRLVKEYSVDMYIHGHNHLDKQAEFLDTKIVSTAAACDGFYRNITVTRQGIIIGPQEIFKRVNTFDLSCPALLGADLWGDHVGIEVAGPWFSNDINNAGYYIASSGGEFRTKLFLPPEITKNPHSIDVFGIADGKYSLIGRTPEGLEIIAINNWLIKSGEANRFNIDPRGGFHQIKYDFDGDGEFEQRQDIYQTSLYPSNKMEQEIIEKSNDRNRNYTPIILGAVGVVTLPAVAYIILRKKKKVSELEAAIAEIMKERSLTPSEISEIRQTYAVLSRPEIQKKFLQEGFSEENIEFIPRAYLDNLSERGFNDSAMDDERVTEDILDRCRRYSQ